MKKTYFNSGKKQNMTGCIWWGAMTSIITSIVLLLILTSFIENGKIGEGNPVGILLTRVISVTVGCVVGTSQSKKFFIPIIAIISAIYWVVLLLLGAIIFNATFQQLFVGTISVLVGAVISMLINLIRQKNGKIANRLIK